MERIWNIIILLRGQLWILPLALSLLALRLAYWVLAFSPSLFGDWADGEFWWLYGGDASGARGLLSSLLSGLMTMFSLVASVTFVILTLAANNSGRACSSGRPLALSHPALSAPALLSECKSGSRDGHEHRSGRSAAGGCSPR